MQQARQRDVARPQPDKAHNQAQAQVMDQFVRWVLVVQCGRQVQGREGHGIDPDDEHGPEARRPGAFPDESAEQEFFDERSRGERDSQASELRPVGALSDQIRTGPAVPPGALTLRLPWLRRGGRGACSS